jgi:hypothetical protein
MLLDNEVPIAHLLEIADEAHDCTPSGKRVGVIVPAPEPGTTTPIVAASGTRPGARV